MTFRFVTDQDAMLFSHRDVLELTQISSDTIQNWVKRGVIKPHVEAGGRGKPRRYSLSNVVQIQFVNALSRLGLSFHFAPQLWVNVSPSVDKLCEQLSRENPNDWTVIERGPMFEGHLENSYDWGERQYRIWLIDPQRLMFGNEYFEFLIGADGRPVIDRGAEKLPLSAIWFSIDVMLNGWVMDAIEWLHDGRPSFLDRLEPNRSAEGRGND